MIHRGRLLVAFILTVGLVVVSAARASDNTPPEGYVALFNGQDLSGWKGEMKEPLNNPQRRLKASPEELAAAENEADEVMRAHWRIEDGALVYDGKGRGLATARDYGNFELYVDWKIGPGGDSGIYLRGLPQVQIWDNPIGSGGLYNNKKHPDKPTKNADKPVGQWNSFFVRMVGDKVTVKVNGETVVDEVVMENYVRRDQPVYPTGVILLQHHGNPLFFKNIYLRELPAE